MPDIVHVAVAVIINDSNEVCISLRHQNVHQGGLWEFPGGKVKQGETVEQALTREVNEELGLHIERSRKLITIQHTYPDKKVCLHVNLVRAFHGQAVGLEGQQVKWLPLNQLSTCTFPAANSSIIKALQLPDKYLITGKFSCESEFLQKLEKALNNGIQLVQLRLKDGELNSEKIALLIQRATKLCSKVEVKLLLNIPQDYLRAVDLSAVVFDGFHADSKTLKSLSQRPECELFSASCHNKEELLKAIQLKADFVVLSPVQKTASHPDMQAMGWQSFSRLVEICPMPVYALGGVSADDIPQAWLYGAQGVAAISAFWN